jgi:hypothetical protein
MTTSYVAALQKIDPTEGLVSYVQTVKPYHSKVLDISIDYVYTETVAGTITETFTADSEYTLVPVQTVLNCGYGHIWDTTAAYSTSTVNKIITATGIRSIVVATSTVSTELTVLTSNDFQPTVGQVVTIQPITSLPTSTPQIVPGLLFTVLSASSGVIEVAAEGTTTPVTFAGEANQQFRLVLQQTQTNSFLVTSSPGSPMQCFAVDATSNVFAFGTPYPIVSVDSTNNAWIIGDNISSLLSANSPLYINTPVEPTFSKQYTVTSVFFDGVNTYVSVQEPVFLVPTGSYGIVLASDSNLPWWLPGVTVTLQSTGTLPSPLSSSQSYYFAPTETRGFFNLATVRYPSALSQYVDITSVGTGILSITRQDTYLPGDVIQVSGTAYSRNNGTYTVREVVQQSPTTTLLYTVEPILQTTPPTLTSDGVVETTILGYSQNRYCIPVQSGPLDLNGYVVETLMIDIDLQPFEFLVGRVVEVDSDQTYSQQSVDGYPQVQLLPTGFDGQLFDIGGMGETISTLPKTALGQVTFG